MKKKLKLSLILISMMMTSCKIYDPTKCPEPEIIGDATSSRVSYAQFRCSFRKQCLAKFVVDTRETICKDLP